MHPLIAALYATVLQFAAGSMLATAMSDWRGEVTPGFLRLAALTTLAGAALVYALSAGAELGERVATLSLLILAAAFGALQLGGRGTLRLGVGVLSALVGIVGLVLAAWSRPSPTLGAGWTALAGLASAIALGAATMALLLGHWYLVTPRLSARPLRRLCDLAIGSLLVLSCFGLWFVGTHPEAPTLGPNDALFRWGGLAAITIFPVGVTIAARVCCQEWPRGRAIQAATGLLYITVAIVLAGALAGNLTLLGG